MYDKIKQAAGFGDSNSFDNFDPDQFTNVYSDRFDPDSLDGGQQAATKINTAQPGQKLQLNLSIVNATASQINIELFSALDSITTRKKAELAVGNYLMVPLLSYEGLAIAANANTVGFNQAGNLEVRGNAGDPKLTVGCGEYPYVSLFESTKTLPMVVSFTRYTVTTDGQINNNITWFKRTFGGKTETNTISPRAYFKPNQFQGKTIDIIAGYQLDSESGLLIPINAGETVQMALFVQRWAKPTV